MCLSLIPKLDPERTIVTVFPAAKNKKMRITYSLFTPTNSLGHFLMCIPFKIPDGEVEKVEVSAIKNIENLFRVLPYPELKIGDKPTMRSLGNVESSVNHTISGPFEIFFIKNTLDLDEVRNAMKDCDISEKRQDLMIEQMKSLNCAFVLAKYMPIENLLYEYAKNNKKLIKILPDDSLYMLTRSIQNPAKLEALNSIQNLAKLEDLAFKEIIKDKLNELKKKYFPNHKMKNGLCIEFPFIFQTPLECMFVLHEWNSTLELENPRWVDQKFQILCHKDYKINGDEKLFYTQKFVDGASRTRKRVSIQKQIIVNPTVLKALNEFKMFSSEEQVHNISDTVALYDYYGVQTNEPIQLIHDPNPKPKDDAAVYRTQLIVDDAPDDAPVVYPSLNPSSQQPASSSSVFSSPLAPPQNSVEAMNNLQQLFNNELITKDEFDERRKIILDILTTVNPEKPRFRTLSYQPHKSYRAESMIRMLSD